MMKMSFIAMILGALLLWGSMSYSRHDLDVGQKIGRTIVEKIIMDSRNMSEHEKHLVLTHLFGYGRMP